MELDKDLLARQEARHLALQAQQAQKLLEEMSQEQLDAIVETLAEGFAAHAQELAAMANC